MNRTTIEFIKPQTPRPAYKQTPRKTRSRKQEAEPLLKKLLPPIYLDADFFQRYRSMVDKNYEKSTLKEYVFPRQSPFEKGEGSLCTDTSNSSSIESMRGVSSYRLCSQNKKHETHIQLSATQRIFGNSKEDVLRVFHTEPKNPIPKNLHKRNASPMFLDLHQRLELQARKTQDRRIFFTKTRRLRTINHTQRPTQRDNPEQSLTKAVRAPKTFRTEE